MTTIETHLRSANHYYDRNVREWMISLVFVPLAVYFCFNRGVFTVLDNAALLIHEAGHFFFAPLGQTAHVAGGTLMQLLLPLLVVFHFLRHAYRPGVQVGLFWVGHNLLNISVYAADAQEQHLPLLGGENVFHDWNVMLTQAGILEFDTEAGNFIFILAIASFGLSVLMPLIMWHDGE